MGRKKEKKRKKIFGSEKNIKQKQNTCRKEIEQMAEENLNEN